MASLGTFSFLFYKEFSRVLCTVASTEPTVVHDNLLSGDSTLITTQSWAPPEESQMLDEGQEVTLELKLVTEGAMSLEQLPHILAPYSEELFEGGPGEQLAAEPTSEQA